MTGADTQLRRSASSDRPPVYLCQVAEGVSCGACCGLYNVADSSRQALAERMMQRTRAFARTPRNEDGIEGFRRGMEGWTPEERPFPQFHHCPFLGMVGRGSVGCLLHPAAPGNQGRDFRYLSYYGAKACATYFCPASRCMPPRMLRILGNLFDDWYPYGLVVTEHRLVQAAFSVLEGLVVRPLGPNDFPRHSPAADRLRTFFELKLTWSYRDADAPGPCHFPFDNGLYSRPELQWPAAPRLRPAYATILREMETLCRSAGERDTAIALLDRHFSDIALQLGRRS